jgi:tetrapyrrole methylase family protein / MazG family protein
MQKPPSDLRDFQALVQVVAALRGPDGCPWDKEQTHQTLTRYAIEETHELVEAIENSSPTEVCEELGDVLLQVVLHAEIARQAEQFDIVDVIEGIAKKMVHRHPHVFGDGDAKTSQEVLKKWDELKQKEKDADPAKANDPFVNIPKAMPALMRSQKIGAKTVRFNFDWTNPQEVLAKLDEEVAELKEAIAAGDNEHAGKEIGDVLFTVAQLARHLDLDSEQSLRGTNQKFESRFKKMREIVHADGKKLEGLKINELEPYWQKAKKSVG